MWPDMGAPEVQDAPDAPRAFSVRQASERLGLEPTTIYTAISKGDLRAKRVGSRLRVESTALRDWWDGLDDAASEAS